MICSSVSAILPLDARDRGDELTLLAVEARRFALQGGEAGDRHEVLLVEPVHAFQLLVDQAGLLALGGGLRFEPADFLAQLGDALAQLRALPLDRGAAGLEQAALATEHFGDVGMILPGDQGRRGN